MSNNFDRDEDNQTLTLRQQQAAARRRQILETAQRLFARQGFAATTTRQIAEAVGVAESLIFHYFPTKASLISAIAHQPGLFHSEFLGFLRAAEDRAATEVLEALLRIWGEHMWAGAELFGVLLAETQSNPEVASAFRAETETMVAGLADYLQKRVQGGELQAGTPVAALARTFLSSVLMFFMTHRFDTKADYRAAFAERAQEMRLLWQVWLVEPS